jgi:hypothetical protein
MIIHAILIHKEDIDKIFEAARIEEVVGGLTLTDSPLIKIEYGSK